MQSEVVLGFKTGLFLRNSLGANTVVCDLNAF